LLFVIIIIIIFGTPQLKEYKVPLLLMV